MTILQQVLLAFAAFVLFIFAIRLVFALLLRLQLLPILVWLGVGRIYPQWAAEHPFVFYGVLAFFVPSLAFNCATAYPSLNMRTEKRRASARRFLVL